MIKQKVSYQHEYKDGRTGNNKKYEFSEMKPGGSLWYETTPQSLLGCFKAWAKRNNKDWKAGCKREVNEGVPGTRIWRLA